jgi:hypothetical protein
MTNSILTNLYADPLTGRIVYLSTGAEFPTKSMVIDNGALRLFAPNTVVKVPFTEPLPPELNAQNCWDYVVKRSETQQLSVLRVASPQPQMPQTPQTPHTAQAAPKRAA